MGPTEHGWAEKEGMLKPVWFTGNQLPDELGAVLGDNDVEECEDGDDPCSPMYFTDEESDEESSAN